MSDEIEDIIAGIAGKRIPGGCEHCNSYQVAETVEPRYHRMTVYHDDWCPLWVEMTTR
jgi:hypothetical protein